MTFRARTGSDARGDGPVFIGAAELSKVLTMRDAIDALEAVYAAALPVTPQRQVVTDGGVSLLSMPSLGAHWAGVKTVTIQPANPSRGIPLINGVYVLFQRDTMQPVAILDAAALTAVRTAAVSALATKYLAPPGPTRLLVFGSGVQARAHVDAIAAVRELSDVGVIGRSEQRVAEFVASLARTYPVHQGKMQDVATADVICTCTTSPQPLFDGSLVRSGAHINAVGTHSPDTREVDSMTVRRAAIVVETREAALAEAGDLLIPLDEGIDVHARIVAELSDVVRSGFSRTGDDLTLFKSVGVGFEDLAVAGVAHERIANAS